MAGSHTNQQKPALVVDIGVHSWDISISLNSPNFVMGEFLDDVR